MNISDAEILIDFSSEEDLRSEDESDLESMITSSTSPSSVHDEIIPEVISKKQGLPSHANKIRESVEFGSVFLALDNNFFGPQVLLEWLVTVPLTERTQIAYKALCIKIAPNNQYLPDSYHFLVRKPEYTSIAIAYGLSTEIPDNNASNTNNPLIVRLCDELVHIHNNANFRRLSALILSGNGNPNYIRSKLVTCYRARNFPYLRNMKPQEHNVALVAADWPAKFRYNENLAPLVIQRVAELQDQAPIYYAGAAYREYYKVAVKLHKDKLLTQLSRDSLAMFNTFFPNIIDTRILEYSDLAYKIALLSNDVAGYVLGFPVQSMVPNEEQIHQAIQLLSEKGLDGYADYIKEYIVQTHTPILPIPQTTPLVYPNMTDVLFEDIIEYAPFDIIVCQIGNHVHRFSRAEADKLIESKKNPWNNEWLPPTVLSTLKARVSAAKELGLPTARSLRETLARVEDGTLFNSDTEPKIVPPPDSPPISGIDLIETLQHHLMGAWVPGLPDDIPEFSDNVHHPGLVFAEGPAIHDIPVSAPTETPQPLVVVRRRPIPERQPVMGPGIDIYAWAYADSPPPDVEEPESVTFDIETYDSPL